MKNQPKQNSAQITTNNPSPFLAERIREDSNLEMEWLWAAGRVTDIQEQLYCLQRALYIYPNSAEVQRQFDTLNQSSESGAVKPLNDYAPVPGFRALLHRLFQPGTRPITRY